VGRHTHSIRESQSFADILHNAGFGDNDQLAALVEGWRNLISLVKPAAVLCEHAPAALLAGRWTSIPFLAMGTGFSLPPDVAPLPDLTPKSTAAEAELLSRESHLLDRVNRLLTSDGLAPLERLSQLYSAAADRFLMTFPELDHHRRHEGDIYRGLWSLTGGEPPRWPKGDGPKVFAYLKPSMSRWNLEQSLMKLRKLRTRTLVYTPEASSKIAALQSSTLSISSRSGDIAAIAAECDAAVLHGTAGTTTQFLLHGVPVLLLPLFFEQAIFSLRVVELGAGLAADPRRAEQIPAELQTLLTNRDYKRQAAAFAQRYSDYDPLAEQQRIINILCEAIK
jgi:UDP:flavonoid glycosyltransferase YjiC (YdhE family)